MLARYVSQCPLCHGRINPGIDLITREPEKGGRWVHSSCLESVAVDVDALISELLAGT